MRTLEWFMDDAQDQTGIGWSTAHSVTHDPRVMQSTPVLDAEMAWWEVGQGRPVVFLHGNPTSSYLWRNVLPMVARDARCLAPDLVGMGRSGPMPLGGYRFFDHVRYLDAWFDALGLERQVVLVVHDWGSALGFHWATRFPERVAGIVHMESIPAPRRWDDWRPERGEIFRRLRSPEGERLVIEENFFIERILPSAIIRALAPEELDVYRHPFRNPGPSRLPTLVWPRELPIEGEPADVVSAVEGYYRFLAVSRIPKLMIVADPGSMVTGRVLELCRAWPNQREITVAGRHFLQEDSAESIGAAIRQFVQHLDAGIPVAG